MDMQYDVSSKQVSGEVAFDHPWQAGAHKPGTTGAPPACLGHGCGQIYGMFRSPWRKVMPSPPSSAISGSPRRYAQAGGEHGLAVMLASPLEL
jgi:hypothetical protein